MHGFKNVNKLDWYKGALKYLGESVTGTEKGRKETKRFRAFIVFGVLGVMLADMQMNHGSSNVHAQWFSAEDQSR